MLRLIRLAVALWILVVLQTTIVPSVRILDAVPDLPFLLVLLVALQEGGAGGALAGFVAGLFIDLNSPGTLGVSSLVNALSAFVVGSVAHRLVRNSAMTRVLVALLTVLVRDFVLVLVTEPGETGRLLLRGVLPGAGYTALLAVPVMAALERVVGRREEPGRGRR